MDGGATLRNAGPAKRTPDDVDLGGGVTMRGKQPAAGSKGGDDPGEGETLRRAGSGARPSAPRPPKPSPSGDPPSPLAGPHQAGQRLFGRFTLLEKLGQGGMGAVWRVRDEDLKEEKALKLLPEAMARDDAQVEAIIRETSKGQKLTHANIVRIFDLHRDEDMVGVSMEVVEGPTLAKLRTEQPNGVFTPEALKPWIRQICDALDYAHGQTNVVHRDLKPANLMVSKKGEIKITDFGIARTLGESQSMVAHQGERSFTLLYASPQQLNGEDPQVGDDIYSLGATLYDLLTGTPPFTTGDVYQQVHQRPPSSLVERRRGQGLSSPGLPDNWEETILACLAKTPAERPKSAGEVAERLGLKAATTSSKKPLWIALTAGAVLLLAAAGLWAMKRSGGHAVGPAPHMATNGTARSSAGSATGRTDEAGTREPVKPPPKSNEKPPAPALAALTVSANPADARIRIGEEAGQVGPINRQGLKPGTYIVAAEKDGYETLTTTVTLSPGQTLDLNTIILLRSLGSLDIESQPAGLAFELMSSEPGFKGRKGLARATLTGLPTGSYTLKGVHPVLGETRVEVQIRRQAKESVTLRLPYTTLNLTSKPAGATVKEGEKVLGKTPYSASPVKPGRTAYELSLAGFKTVTLAANLEDGRAFAEEVVLQRLIPVPQAGQRFTNSLGMAFAPVKGTKVLFAIWETRVQDYDAFVRTKGMSWPQPDFPQGPSHPAVNVSWNNARAFCQWLTERDRAEGRLLENQRYRLPADAEWSLAAGLEQEFGATPKDRSNGNRALFPWGTAWPPPPGAVNANLEEQSDPHPKTAPVGSLTPNAVGLYDLAGNVWEWCEDDFDAAHQTKAIRGGCFATTARQQLLAAFRSSAAPTSQNAMLGFRCVIDVEP